MEAVRLYKLKKGDHFKYINVLTGQPEQNTYIKGRPHTDPWDHRRKMYATLIYAPGESYDNSFCGYVDHDVYVVKVDDNK